MTLDIRRDTKLVRLVRYAAVALLVGWSLLALAGYAVLGTVGGWMASLELADGWVAWLGQFIGQAGGPAVGILWFAGALIILGAMAVIRRVAT